MYVIEMKTVGKLDLRKSSNQYIVSKLNIQQHKQNYTKALTRKAPQVNFRQDKQTKSNHFTLSDNKDSSSLIVAVVNVKWCEPHVNHACNHGETRASHS